MGLDGGFIMMIGGQRRSTLVSLVPAQLGICRYREDVGIGGPPEFDVELGFFTGI